MNRVVHLLRWCLPFTSSFIRNQIIYHQRYQPSVVYTQPKPGKFYDDIHTKASTLFPLRTSFDQILYRYSKILSANAKSQVREFLAQQRPDVLHIHYGVDCIVYSNLIEAMGVPSCVSFYGYDCTTFPKRFFGIGGSLLKKYVFNNSSVKAVLAMTDDMKADLLRIGCPEEKIIVHYYGIETEPFFIEPRRTENASTSFLIISALFEKKGHKYLIDAFENVSRELKGNCELHIVGDGPLFSSMKDEIEARQLLNVRLHGPVVYGSDQHKKFLRDADVFVHPSVTAVNGDKEGIPGAIIEAMAAGLPVITTYHAGIPSVIQNDITGLLVPEKDTKALESAMIRLATDMPFREAIAQRGQRFAMEELDIAIKEKELEDIYDLIAQKM